MEYINHITMQSGHTRKSYANEVDKSIYLALRSIYKKCLKGKVEVADGYTAQATEEKGKGLMITVFAPDGMPILTSGYAKRKNTGVWELMHSSAMLPAVTNPKIEAEAPYILDRLEIGALAHMDALAWTGDFSRCMGWMYLCPEKVR